jgi:hypothetical protein
MPPSQQKRIEISDRRALVRRLLEIGLHRSEIRRALGLSKTEAGYDILKITEEIGNTNEPPSERKKPRSAYCEALRVYAGLAAGLDEQVAGLRDALRSYLDINHLSANCEGVAAALRTSLAGSENKRLDGYKRLAMAVIGGTGISVAMKFSQPFWMRYTKATANQWSAKECRRRLQNGRLLPTLGLSLLCH